MTIKSVNAVLFLPLLALAACLASPWALAQNDLGTLLQQDDEFLPVEKAYQVAVTVQDAQLQLDWDIAPGYYLYRDKFKIYSDVSQGARKLDPQLPPGEIQFDDYFKKEVEIYYDTARITVPIAEMPTEFDLKVRSQGCADAGLCYAPRTQYFQINRNFKTAVESDSSAVPGSQSGSGASSGSSGSPLTSATGGQPGSILLYLVLAMCGGLILNLMPCVFPVLSLKALTFASTSGSAHSHHLHGWAYTAGVVGSFLIAALIIIAARAAGEGAGWGFQLQSPVFVAVMTYLFLVMGLSLSGLVHFGTSLMGFGHGLTANEGLRGSFFTGILAAVVASPCTGPMMAPALGFALTQPTVIALTIFIALGLGMALPFLLLSYSPKLANMLPRPGIWMEKLKELLAFPMYLTAAWLLFVFGRQVGMVGVFFLLIGAVAIAFAIWLWQNQPERSHWRRFVQGIALVSLLFAGYVALTSERFRTETDDWLPYSRELVRDLRSDGQPVFVDFTADWCITCKANEAIALSREQFKETVARHNFALVKGDWTNEDPVITEVLTEFKRSGVPLYLVYPADLDRPPEVLPQLLTQNIVLQALERALPPSSVAATEAASD